MESYIIDTPELQLTQLEFLIRLLVACGIGFLIGLEREYAALTKNENIFAGIRTFVFLTLLGFIGAGMNYLLSPWIFTGVLLAVIILTSISYWITATRGDIGGTSEITAIIAVLLGGLTFLGYMEVSLMITVIIVVFLSSKIKLQAVIGKITHEELYAFIRFVVVVLLIFPFLPDAAYGPFHVINPREIGWVIILTSGLGFVGYVLMRIFGVGKGILLTGILGGLVSSTAVTWIFAKKSKEQPLLSSNYATAIFAASSIMPIRGMIWVFIFNKTLLEGLYAAIGVVFLAAIGVTLFFYFREKKKQNVDASIPLGKPLNLTGALFFGIIYMVILLVIAYANEFFGERGIYITSGIAGLTDLDAITISISKLGGDSISAHMAQNAILIATTCNTVLKFGIALWAGSQELKKYIYVGFGLILLGALIAFGVLNI